jgi:uncharacterized delta-60 repeat protein
VKPRKAIRPYWFVAAFLVIAAGCLAPAAIAAPGDLDPSFGDGGKVRTPIKNSSLAYAIGRQSTGKLIAAGCSAGSEPGSQAFQFTIARYTASGVLDPSFGENGVRILSFPNDPGTACVEDLAIRPDDSIVLAGRAMNNLGNNQDFAIAQLAPDGQLDDNFGTESRVTLHPGNPEKHAGATAITLDPAGRAVVAGKALTDYGDSNKRDAQSFAAVRIEPNGTLDTSFGDNGEVVLGMHETSNPEPGSGIGSGVADVVRYTDGRIELVGTAFDNWQDGNHQLLGRVAIARLTSSGQLDSSFSGDGKLVTPVRSANESALFNAAALTPDGRITVGGASDHQALVARFGLNGEPDLTFGSAGSTLLALAELGGCCATGVQALHYQADGKLMIAGISDPPAGLHPRFGVARLDTNGEPDPSFGVSGVVSGPPFEGAPDEPWGGGAGTAYAYDLVLEPSGDIVAAGAASGLFDDSTHFALARYLGDTPPPPLPLPLLTYVALGDSYSSGFGAGDYEPGTHKDGSTYPNNDCQRSANAFGPVIADELDMSLVFKACQGAVTRDLLFPSAHPWAEGESAQVVHLGPDVGLVTFSIGGNDADFAGHLAECILGFELLPFNTCSGDKKVTEPVQEALERLDGLLATPAQIVPYDDLFKEVRKRTPFATRVAVGYPEFFLEEGGDRTSLPGGRCEAVKQADQRWIVEQIRNVNRTMKRIALDNGFLFVDPSPYFDGHELCSGGKEWFFPLLASGQFHPTPEGQHAIADAVLDALDADADPPGSISFTVSSGEIISHAVTVPSGSARLTVSTEWPGSDVLASLTSPLGETYTRSHPGPAAYHDNGPTWEQFEIVDPEPGDWRIELYGADVSPNGEPVSLTTQVENAPNTPPTANISYVREGNNLLFDASQSSDADGEISAYEWYVTSPTAESTAAGPALTLPAESPEGRTVTLIVTDDQSSTGFAAVTIPASSMEPQGNSGLAAPALSIVDSLAPSLYDIRLQTRTRRGWKRSKVVHGPARLLAQLSEDAKVTLQLASKHRGGKRQVLNLLAGEQQISLARLLHHVLPGGYQLGLAAQDSAGNVRKYRVGFRVVRRPRRSPQAK